MLGNIYSGCCCFTRYYPRPTYQELDDIEVKTNNQGEKDNLNKTAGADLDYRSTVISNPSSSSFEVEDSENEEIAKLSTDMYNTNNLNNQFNENGSVTSKKTSGQEKTRAPSAFTIQSDVSVQLSSWQSASFAMAQASVSTAGRKKSSSSVGLDSVEGESASSSLSGESHLEERNKKQGWVSPLGQLKEEFNKGSLGETGSIRLGIYTSLTVNQKLKDNKQSNISENSSIRIKVVGDRSQKAEEVEERNPNQGEAIVLKDLEMTIVEEGGSTETDSPGILKNPLISPVMQPIKTILGVFSSCDQAEPETPIETAGSAVVKEPETVEESEENEVSSESDPGESSSYSIATSDISTDPTSEDEGNGIQESFFPELYQTAETVNFNKVTTAKRLSRQNSWVGRYPVLKPEEDSSSIATDELSETTNDVSSTHNEEETPRSESEISESSMSDYERLSGRESDLEVESLEQELDEPEFNDETKLNQEQLEITTDKDKLSKLEKETEEEPVPEGYYSNSFVRYDPNTNEFVRYDDPELIETDGSMRAQRNSESIFQLESDSNFSFPGRAAADEGEKEEGEDEKEEKEEEPVLELESPVPSSCMDGSTIVGSCGTGVTASSGGDTMLSVSRTGTRSEEGKKKGGIVSRFKRKMLKK